MSIERNARLFVWSNGLQNIGDQLVSGKTVLPWLFSALGVPPFFTALLVPLREAGSMLPQAALTPWVTGHAHRTRLWVLGSLGQGLCGMVIVAAAALADAWVLGLVVVLALAALAVFRALCSLTGKDVQGRTIPKGDRGAVTGRAAELGGAVTLAVGAVLWWMGELSRGEAVGLLAIGAATWFIAAVVFRGIAEPPETASEGGIGKRDWWQETWGLFTGDRAFREFVTVRSLLLVTALSTSFIVMLAGNTLTGLAGFVLASGLSGLIGGRLSGVWSDRSSRLVMSWGALCATLIIAVLVAWTWPAWVYAVGFFAVNLAHTAIRVARKTYVVDMAGDDKRTLYVGAANTMMGVILLGVGGISAVIALAGPRVALVFLAAIGLLGAWRARKLPEVSLAG